MSALLSGLLFTAALAAPVTAPSPSPPILAPAAQPLRMSATAMGEKVEIEVRDLPPEAAQAAIQAALAEVFEIDRLTDPARPDSQVATLNARAGKGPQPTDRRLLAIFARALDFCIWSDRTHGPLGQPLYRLWGLPGTA
ncbi:MAG: FAD:protein FMN transferase, partial [Acidobacteriota bacterium]|nr:FAD:protein FMN transferase [Acidobacteriota bacterium]